MIVTLTANTTMDQAMIVPEFKPGGVNRARITQHSMGAKPTNASWILGKHGVKSRALGLAAGAIGGKIRSLLEDHGVEVDFVEAEGESRMAIALIDEATGTETTILPNSLYVRKHHIAELRVKFTAALQSATCVVMGGSLPNGMDISFYPEFIKLARKQNVPVIMDVKPEIMRVALRAGVDFIKPNTEEFAGLFGTQMSTSEEIYEAAQLVQKLHGAASVVSMGADGAVAVLPDRSYRIPAIPVDAISAVGAGDAVLAGIAYAVGTGKPLEDGLRLGIGTATAVCMQPGTAMFDVADARRFMEQVELIPLT
ncbi:MAG: 1-phosphofructokinase family hexose kinase [Chloroflexota bacterium]